MSILIEPKKYLAQERNVALKIFTDINHYHQSNRSYLADLLRPLFKEMTDEERLATYGISAQDFCLVDQIEQAELCILPMSLNYYLRLNKVQLYRDFVKKAQLANVPCGVFMQGDYGVKCRDKDLIVFRQSGYHHKSVEKQFNLPVFIRDPLLKMRNDSGIVIKEKTDKPTVAFCGQADDSWLKMVFKPFRLLAHNVKYHLRLSSLEPQNLIPPTFIRRRAISLLEKNPELKSNFILRKSYKGGAKTPHEAEILKREFLENLNSSIYALCVRGTGNFSARLYEAMALGRIPIFINTDCNVPWHNELNWRDFTVWVEYRELNQLAEKLLDFHRSHNADQLKALQVKNRQVWENYLSFGSFWRHFKMIFENGYYG